MFEPKNIIICEHIKKQKIDNYSRLVVVFTLIMENWDMFQKSIYGNFEAIEFNSQLIPLMIKKIRKYCHVSSITGLEAIGSVICNLKSSYFGVR